MSDDCRTFFAFPPVSTSTISNSPPSTAIALVSTSTSASNNRERIKQGTQTTRVFLFFWRKNCWRVRFLLCIIEFSAPGELEVHVFWFMRRMRSKKGCLSFPFSAFILFLDIIIVCSSGTEPFKHIFKYGVLRLDLDLPRSVSVFFEPCGSTASLHRSLEEKIGETFVVDVVASCTIFQRQLALPAC